MSTAIAEVEVVQKALSVPEQAKAIVIITDNETYIKADEILQNIAALQKEIDAAFDPIINKAHQAHKEAIAQKKKAEAPLQEAAGILKPRMAEYRAEQERLRQEAERIAREEAARREEEDRINAAADLEAQGETEAAAQVLDTPAPVVAPKVASFTPRTATKFRTQYSATVTNLQMLIKAVAEGKVPIQALTPNTPFLNTMARNMKETLNYPGVKVDKRTV